jgi:(+)-abscisic acid 8'-hydroxylase
LLVFFPPLLVLAALLAATLLFAERWRSRSRYGSARRLPPGRLSLVPRRPWVDEKFFAAQAKNYGSVFKVSQYFRPMICISGSRLGTALFQRHAESLVPPPVRFNAFIPGGFIRYMDADVHDKYRRIFQVALNRQVLEANRPLFDTQIKRGLAELSTASRSLGGVHPSAILSEALFGIMLRLFAGIDDKSQSFEELKELYGRLDINKAGCGKPKREILVARQIAGILRQRADEFTAIGGAVPNAPPCVLSEILRQDPQASRDDTVLLNLVYMIQIGRTDLSGLFTWIFKLLIDNPQWANKQRGTIGSESTLSSNGDSALAGNIVKEVLRLEQSEYIYRKALADIEFESFVIPKGWLVRICIREGHRDAAVFSDPNLFDADRFKDQTYRRGEYCPLGIGRHSCLGNQVVDTVGKLFVSDLTMTYDISVIVDGPREYGRAHWEPSSDLRLELVPRDVHQ